MRCAKFCVRLLQSPCKVKNGEHRSYALPGICGKQAYICHFSSTSSSLKAIVIRNVSSFLTRAQSHPTSFNLPIFWHPLLLAEICIAKKLLDFACSYFNGMGIGFYVQQVQATSGLSASLVEGRILQNAWQSYILEKNNTMNHKVIGSGEL